MEVRDTCFHVMLVFGHKRFAQGRKCKSIQIHLHCDVSTVIPRNSAGYKKGFSKISPCILSCDCHPNASLIKVTDICYHGILKRASGSLNSLFIFN